MDNTNLSILLQQKQAKLGSLKQKRSEVETQLAELGSNMAIAKTAIDDTKVSLSNTVETLSNFIIPDVIDQPDRSDFMSVDEETGEEIFDESGFEAANAEYESSLRAHEEAVKQKAELEADVATRTQELDGAESNYANLVNETQDKENELAAIDNDMNISLSEIDDLNESIKLNIAQETPADGEETKEVPEGFIQRMQYLYENGYELSDGLTANFQDVSLDYTNENFSASANIDGINAKYSMGDFSVLSNATYNGQVSATLDYQNDFTLNTNAKLNSGDYSASIGYKDGIVNANASIGSNGYKVSLGYNNGAFGARASVNNNGYGVNVHYNTRNVNINANVSNNGFGFNLSFNIGSSKNDKEIYDIVQQGVQIISPNSIPDNKFRL